MDLAMVQAAIREVNPYYVDMLDWQETQKQNCTVIKAIPKKTLSYQAHDLIRKTFKHLGGAYVLHNGVAYFELVVSTEPHGEI